MVWPYAIDWELTLKYVQTYLSWPVLATGVAILFGWHFKEDISTFLGNVRPKAPGFDFLPQPLDAPPPPVDAPAAVDVPTAAEAVEDMQAVERAEQAEKEEQFRYLNHLLVPVSQTMLSLIWGHGTISMEEIVQLFSGVDAENRQAMMQVLYQHGLISIDERGLSITDRGAEYVNWPERQAWTSLMAKNVLADNPVRMAGKNTRNNLAHGRWFPTNVSIPRSFSAEPKTTTADEFPLGVLTPDNPYGGKPGNKE